MAYRNWTTATGVTGFQYSAATSTGPVRRLNEDALLAEPPVFLVADGMGGHARGELASATAIDVFRDRIVAAQPWTADAVLDAVAQAHDVIAELGDDADLAGTTLTGVILVAIGRPQREVDDVTGDPVSPTSPHELRYRWMVVNIGDSRVYRLEGDQLHQLTIDHSVVQELVDEGVLAAEEARAHPDKNVITRALGIGERPAADVHVLAAEGVHTFLMCSDGVSGVLGTEEIVAVLRGDVEGAAEAVVERALALGTRDNATAVVLRSTVRSGPEGSSSIAEDTEPRAGLVA